MNSRSRVYGLLCLVLIAWATAAAADNLKIGVVDLSRLIHDSPQAQQAKKNMAAKFAKRKQALAKQSDALDTAIERLKTHGGQMSGTARDKLQSRLRDRQRKLQMQQSEYNDDVSAAEQKEFDRIRRALHSVIHAYAVDHGFDVILGDSVLYATDRVDITDAVLARLKNNKK